jgi:hypothetical protein
LNSKARKIALSDSISGSGYTSLSEESAYAFTHPGEVVEIRFPGGKGGGTFLGDMSEWTTEYEFLLKRNSVFGLLSVPKAQ